MKIYKLKIRGIYEKECKVMARDEVKARELIERMQENTNELNFNEDNLNTYECEITELNI